MPHPPAVHPVGIGINWSRAALNGVTFGAQDIQTAASCFKSYFIHLIPPYSFISTS